MAISINEINQQDKTVISPIIIHCEKIVLCFERGRILRQRHNVSYNVHHQSNISFISIVY